MNVLKEIRLAAEKCGRGHTRHIRGSSDVSAQIVRLRVVQFDEDPSAYVLYFDEHGNELNDLCFGDVERAIEHIQWEFEVKVD
ncbi:MAG: hypothetical protein ACI92S_002232 [Planctomycetaceae bacterium]|jgi:hypothetical protein